MVFGGDLSGHFSTRWTQTSHLGFLKGAEHDDLVDIDLRCRRHKISIPGFLEGIHHGPSGHFSTRWTQTSHLGFLKGAEHDDLVDIDLRCRRHKISDPGFSEEINHGPSGHFSTRWTQTGYLGFLKGAGHGDLSWHWPKVSPTAVIRFQTQGFRRSIHHGPSGHFSAWWTQTGH